MRNQFLICVILFTLTNNTSASFQEEKKVIDSTYSIDNEISFLFMGDFMQHGPQIKAAKDSNGNYNYERYFEYTESLIKEVDFAIANLEVTLAGKPYSGYPRFSAPDAYAVAIKDAGFDVLTTANNHSNDRGSLGLIRTIRILDSLNIKHLGTYQDSIEKNENYPLIIEKNGIKVGLLNYTYGTNGLETQYPNIVNMIDEKKILRDIRLCKQKQVDKIIAIAHWGKEYLSFPDQYQKRWGEWMFSNGIDIIIGGHPHSVQPAEYRKSDLNQDQLIIWSLGNIVSNQRKEHTDGGSSLQFSLYKDSNGEIKIKNVGYHLHWVWIHNQNQKNIYQILPITKAEKTRLSLDKNSQELMSRFIQNERSLYLEYNLNVPEYQYDLESDSYYLD